MKTALLVFAAALAPAAAQQAPPEPAKPHRVQKIVQIKHADPDGLKQLLDVFGCCARANQAFKTISLDYPTDVMPAVEDAVRRFDMPAAAPRNVELTAYFLIASDKEGAAGAPVPPEMDAVVKQLRSVFAYKSFAVLDSLLIRAGSGQGGSVVGNAPAVSGGPATVMVFKIERWALGAAENGEVVTIEKLGTDLRLPVATATGPNYITTGITIDRVDIPVGQKVVLGKSGLEGPGKALVIVLSAKVL